MKLKLALLGAVLVAGQLAPADAIDTIIHNYMAQGHIAGVSLAIIRNGKVIKESSYGYANLEDKTKVTPHTVFEIGSMTKQFVAMNLLILADQGKFSLNEPVKTYLGDDVPPLWQPIPMQNILTHTAGIKDFLASFNLQSRRTYSFDDLIKPVSSLPLDFPPGTSWQYSNTDYLIAGETVEKLTNEPLFASLEASIFKPLGMTTATTTDPKAIVPNRARGYAWLGKSWENLMALNPTQAQGAGYLAMSVRDLEKWAIALDDEKLLSKKGYAEYYRSERAPDGHSFGYALAWFIGHDQGYKLVDHGGNTAAFSTDIFRVPQAKLDIILLTNASGQNPGLVSRIIANKEIPQLDLSTVKAGADPHPEWTAKLKSLITDKFDWSDFTPTFNEEMKTLRGMAYSSLFNSLRIQKCDLAYLESEPDGPNTLSTYAISKAVKGLNITLYLGISWSPDGLIDNVIIKYQESKKLKK